MKFWQKKTQEPTPAAAQVESGFADAFEATLSEQEIHFTTEVNDRGDAIFRIPYRTEAARRVTVLLQFDRAENVIRFYAFGYIQNTPPEREQAILEKLNDVNRRLLFYKFYLDDDRDIVLCWYFPYLAKEQLFSPGGLNLYILRALDMLDKLHDEFMAVVDGETEMPLERADAKAAEVVGKIAEVPSAVEAGSGMDEADAGDREDEADAGDLLDEADAVSTEAAAVDSRNSRERRREGDAAKDAPDAAMDGGPSSSEEAADTAEPRNPTDDEAPRKDPPRLYVVKPREPDA